MNNTPSKKSLRLSRDLVLLIAGLAGLGHETVVQDGERTTLIIAFLAMCGFPVFLRTDELYSDRREENQEQKSAGERDDG